jgi:predicted nucleotide-binding protein
MTARRNSEQRHIPTLTPAIALKRMRVLLEQINSLQGLTEKNTPEFDTWEQNVKLVLTDFYGAPSPFSDAFESIWFTPGSYYPRQPLSDFVNARRRGLSEAEGFLRSRIGDIEETLAETPQVPLPVVSIEAQVTAANSSIFVVHGHDTGTKEMVARFLGKLGLKPIILHEQADMGRTLIEKFEHHSAEASCAVVLLTPDDIGSARDGAKEEQRARQNVVLELGFFVGKLGRNRTFALTTPGVVLPSDLQGLIYSDLGVSDWTIKLARELKAAGVEFDTSKLL